MMSVEIFFDVLVISQEQDKKKHRCVQKYHFECW